MFKDPGQQEPIPKIMLSSGACHASDVSDHYGKEIQLFPYIRWVGQALIHSISLITPLTLGNNVLDDKLE